MVNKEFNVPYTIGCQQFLHSAAMFKMSFVAARRRGGGGVNIFLLCSLQKGLAGIHYVFPGFAILTLHDKTRKGVFLLSLTKYHYRNFVSEADVSSVSRSGQSLTKSYHQTSLTRYNSYFPFINFILTPSPQPHTYVLLMLRLVVHDWL